MPIIVESEGVQADISVSGGFLDIDFLDPAFVRCDKVLVDVLRRTIGVVLHEGYHEVETLSGDIDCEGLEDITTARLSGQVGGHTISLRVPVKFSNRI